MAFPALTAADEIIRKQLILEKDENEFFSSTAGKQDSGALQRRPPWRSGKFRRPLTKARRGKYYGKLRHNANAPYRKVRSAYLQTLSLINDL